MTLRRWVVWRTFLMLNRKARLRYRLQQPLRASKRALDYCCKSYFTATSRTNRTLSRR